MDVLRKGVSHGPVTVDLYKLLPTPGNTAAADAFEKNIFSVTRQVRYSNDSGNELDLVVFINGLPVLTFELKNSLTKQTVADAIVQYQITRDPKELLFQSGRCIAHMAVDDAEVRFCTELKGKASWFLPFNQGWNSGAGNPPNPNGIKTDYLWKQVLVKASLANIIENYAQVVEDEEQDAGGRRRKIRKPVFPRFHQLRTVRALLRRSREDGVGKRYLVQHSAGSGKSNTIGWLAHRLASLHDAADEKVFDTVIVVTDRRVLDKQLQDTIYQFEHRQGVVQKIDEDSRQPAYDVVVAGGGVWRAVDQGVFRTASGAAYAPWRDWREATLGLPPVARRDLEALTGDTGRRPTFAFRAGTAESAARPSPRRSVASTLLDGRPDTAEGVA